MYEAIKKFLDEGGRCLLIENGKPIGVVLTMEEYEKIKDNKKEINDTKENPIPTLRPEVGGRDPDQSVGIGEAVANEMEFSGVSANIDEINLADAESVTLEDLGLDELPY